MVPRLRGLPFGLGLALRLRGLPFGLGLALRLRGLPFGLGLTLRLRGLPFGLGLTLRLRGLPFGLGLALRLRGLPFGLGLTASGPAVQPGVACGCGQPDSLAAWQPHWDSASEPRMPSAEPGPYPDQRRASPQSETRGVLLWPARLPWFAFRREHPPLWFPAFAAPHGISGPLAHADQASVALPRPRAGIAADCLCSFSVRQVAWRPQGSSLLPVAARALVALCAAHVRGGRRFS